MAANKSSYIEFPECAMIGMTKDVELTMLNAAPWSWEMFVVF